MQPTAIELTATTCLAAAVLHTFLAGFLRRISHWLAEVELIFGIWAAVFLLVFAVLNGFSAALGYLQGVHFGEAVFVFVVMAGMSTGPVIKLAGSVIEFCSRGIPLPKGPAYLLACLTIGPLLGSFITEPAAMTVTALLLLRVLSSKISEKFLYFTLGTLFVNISIGGTLTHYAAPPVLMVVRAWNWDLKFMFMNFGWKSFIAVVLCNLALFLLFRREISKLSVPAKSSGGTHKMKLKEAAFVAVFLSGLVILGGLQRWWLEPMLAGMDGHIMFAGAVGITAIVDNAALTYLAAQVPNLGDSAKYFVVAGAVAGGGLTVMANAPNPAGQAILAPLFGKSGVSAFKLLTAALIPTFIACACLYLL